MFDFVGYRAHCGLRHLLLLASLALLLPIAGCNNKAASVEAGPRAFGSAEDAGKALADAAKSQNRDAVLAIFGPGSLDIISSGNADEDKVSLNGFAQAYQVMNRWRKLGDGSELLLVGADNQAFPVPLRKNAAGQWYFDVPAGKEEILARRVGRDEIVAIDVSSALRDAQKQYFAQKHQYAQKFIGDPGQQNGLYWESTKDSARSPIGPLVAFATEEGLAIKPDAAKPFYGYYFHRLASQGPAAKGGVKTYVVNGKETTGFAYVAYPAKYGDSGLKTFLINQDGVIYQKDLGKDTEATAKSMTAFDPDSTWSALG
jgi:hypothetical protein